jgi:peptidoglycan/xylan/chitin deacetylase (PgdA/CDA1 family)
MTGYPSRRAFLATLAGAALATACSGSEDRTSTAPTPSETTTGPLPTATTVEQTTATFVDHGTDTTAQVALTFHTNGDVGLAERLLAITVQRATPVTCFVVGEWLEQHPEWARKLLDAGHELANHTYSHPDSTALGREALADEITRCRDVLTRLTGRPGRFFRPSGVDDGTVAPSRLILDTALAAGYETVLGFDVDPHDYQDPGPQHVTERVLDSVRAGSVVSLHFGHEGTIEALPAVLDGLAAKNLRPVTASQLLSETGGPD